MQSEEETSSRLNFKGLNFKHVDMKSFYVATLGIKNALASWASLTFQILSC